MQYLRQYMIILPNEKSFRTYNSGDYQFARQLHLNDPPPQANGETHQNKSLKLWNGHLYMADVNDFRSTFVSSAPDVVITMCSKPPEFPSNVSGGLWLHRDFSGYELENYGATGTIVLEAREALIEGKTVLIHCLEGQDRTGVVGLCLLRMSQTTLEYDGIVDAMSNARPKRVNYWFNSPLHMLKNRGYYHRISTKLQSIIESHDNQ